MALNDGAENAGVNRIKNLFNTVLKKLESALQIKSTSDSLLNMNSQKIYFNRYDLGQRLR